MIDDLNVTAEDGLSDQTLVVVAMPALTSDGGVLVRWSVRAGQAVHEGDILADIAGGNATMELEASGPGTVTRLFVAAGSTVIAAGTPLAEIAIAPETIIPSTSNFDASPREPLSEASEATAAIATGPASDMSFTDALRQGLLEEMQANRDVFLIGESVADFGRCSGVARGLLDEFGPQRVVGMPITPAAFTGLAVGAAMAGLRPVVEFTGWALALQAVDHIVSTAAKTRYRSGGALGVPIVLRGMNGSWPGAGAMHNVSLASWFAHVPGLKVVCPSTPACAKGLLKAAVRDPDPVLILECEKLYELVGPVPEDDDWTVPIGVARIVRQGNDLTIVTFGRGVAVASAAADTLFEAGISAEIVDLRSLRPLDMKSVLASVRRTGRLLALDDDWPVASLGAEICASVASEAFSALKAAPVRLSASDVPAPFAANLEALLYPDAAEVAARARRMLA